MRDWMERLDHARSLLVLHVIRRGRPRRCRVRRTPTRSVLVTLAHCYRERARSLACNLTFTYAATSNAPRARPYLAARAERNRRYRRSIERRRFGRALIRNERKRFVSMRLRGITHARAINHFIGNERVAQLSCRPRERRGRAAAGRTCGGALCDSIRA